MKKQGFGVKVAGVFNALLLVVGFIGCQGGALNWLSEKSEPAELAPKPAETAPSQELPPTSAKTEPAFIGSSKAIFPPSLKGLVTGLTPAEPSANSPPEPNSHLPRIQDQTHEHCHTPHSRTWYCFPLPGFS